MPRLDDIEQFKVSLRSIGKETQNLARWGETWQDLAAPSQDVPDDIAALLGGLDDAAGTADEAVDAADGGESLEDAGDAFGSLVDSDLASRSKPSFVDGLDELLDMQSGESNEASADEAASDGLDAPDETASLLADFDSLLEPDEGDSGAEGSAFEPEGDPTDAAYPAGAETEPSPDAFDADFADLPDTEAETPSEFADALEAMPELDADSEGIAAPDEAAPAEFDDEASLDAGFDLGDASAAVDEFEVPDSLLDGLPSADEAGLGEENSADDATAEAESFDIPEVPDLPDLSSPDAFGLDDLAALDSTAPVSGNDDFSLPGEDAFSAGAAEVEDASEIADAGALDDIGLEAAESGAAPADDGGIGDLDGMNLGSESAEGDSFDQFDLGGSSEDSFSLDAGLSGDSAESGGPSGAGDLDGQLADLDAEAAAPETFSLDTGWEGDFSIPGFEMGGEAKPAAKQAKAPAPSPDMFAAAPPRQVKKARAVDLTEAQVDALQDTLLSYPLNLRLAVEDIIANSRGTDIQQADLVWMLVDGAKARDAARLAGQVLKRYIEIPAGFEKKTGAAFEAEKGSFRYLFVHSILPVLQVVALVAVAAGALFYLGYSFVYKPIRANHLYAVGYESLELDKYSEAVEFFDRAERDWAMKRWFLRYARGFAGKRQSARAAEIYERLLSRWPKDDAAALEYAAMESYNQAFEKAESVLRRFILERDYFHEAGLALSASNYLDWADFEEQRYEGPDRALVASLYEKARVQLATVMERHGRSDSYMELMLLYFIRTERFGAGDKRKEIEPLVDYVLESKKSGWKASTLAELAEYLMDRNLPDKVHRVLLAAVDRDGSYPEAHAAMARWQRKAGFPKDELKALEYADRFFAEDEAKAGLPIKRLRRYMETLVRLGEALTAAGRPLDAEDALNGAIDRYEKALKGRQVRRDPRYGKAYALLADIYFFGRQDLEGALGEYAAAELNGYRTAETDYRRGYIHYTLGGDEGAEALRFFYRAGLDSKPSPYLLWATANSLYARDDFFAAQGYYKMLADRLQFELDTLLMPSPQAKPSHEEIVQLLMVARNNHGVSLYRIAERIGDVKRRAQAMAELTESARLFDSLSRDQLTMVRSDSKNLGFLNLDFVLHPIRGIDLAVYRDITTSMEYPRKSR